MRRLMQTLTKTNEGELTCVQPVCTGVSRVLGYQGVISM